MASNATMNVVVVENGRYAVSPLTVSVAVVALALFFWRLTASGLDPREPPEAISKIPLFGHLLGMLKHQIYYLEMLGRKTSWPIYTMKVLGSRIYVICSPDLVHNAFRIPKALAFEPFVIESTRRTFNITEEGMKVIGAPPSETGENYIGAIHNSMYTALAPGPALLEMNSRVLSTMARYLDGIGTKNQPKSLYRWTRDVLTIATAEALYGAKNPVSENPKLIDCLWDFETDLTWIMLQVLPTVIARKAFYGRAAINKAFQKWYADGNEKNSAGLIKGRAEAARNYSLSQKDVADFEIAILFTATTNTIPSSFWLLSYIVNSPTLVTEIRAEISQIVSRKIIDGVDTVEMDVTGFQKKCPLLCAAWEETLRLVDSASSVRMVIEDTMLADKYLLKAGSVVQMPSGVTHNSPAIWGDDAALFNPKRFLRSDGKQDLAARERRKVQTQGYFPFGGGKHLCPGRHFAFTEVMGFVATVVYGFEIGMADGSGALKMPKLAKQKMGTGVRKPASDVNVMIKRRDEFEGVKWAYFVGGEVDFKTLSTGEHAEYQE